MCYDMIQIIIFVEVNMNKQIIQQTIHALHQNNFSAEYFPTISAAVEELFKTVAPTESIGLGGSVTLMDAHIAEKFIARGNTVFDHHLPNQTPEQVLQVRRNQLLCDVFLTSTNALTQDGKLVNVDGTGQRVAAMIFGPKKVIVITGMNKITPDLNSALQRLSEVAAPKNNQRLNRPNPCTTTGVCIDCNAATRICNARTIIDKQPQLSNIHVWIVGENLGY